MTVLDKDAELVRELREMEAHPNMTIGAHLQLVRRDLLAKAADRIEALTRADHISVMGEPYCWLAGSSSGPGPFEIAWDKTDRDALIERGYRVTPLWAVPRPTGGDWVPVPREPTKAMATAFYRDSGEPALLHKWFAKAYADMLAAAPASIPPTQTRDEVLEEIKPLDRPMCLGVMDCTCDAIDGWCPKFYLDGSRVKSPTKAAEAVRALKSQSPIPAEAGENPYSRFSFKSKQGDQP